MNTNPSSPAPAVPVRRRLVERYKGSRPSTRTEMVKAYNEAYRERLQKSGTPTRRQLAEAVLQAVIEQITTNPDNAKATLRRAAAILRSVRTEKEKELFGVEGIKARIAVVANNLPPTNP